jgi:hypothetical protein
VADWEIIHGDCIEVMRGMADKSVAHVITDPPYSEVTHAAAAAAAAAARDLPDGNKRRVYASGANGFGFDHLPAEHRAPLASEFARLAARWALIFSDQEGVGRWIEAVRLGGLDHVRVGQWAKIGATPQFTGDRPAQACEAIEIAHAKGRKRWNGGGKHALWSHPIAALDAKTSGELRPEHITPKPVSLMLELVELFTDPGELILDPFCGSGTTGVAAIRLGRRFIGIEKDAKYAALARERLEAESRGLSLREARAGQASIFDLMPPSPPEPKTPTHEPTPAISPPDFSLNEG